MGLDVLGWALSWTSPLSLKPPCGIPANEAAHGEIPRWDRERLEIHRAIVIRQVGNWYVNCQRSSGEIPRWDRERLEIHRAIVIRQVGNWYVNCQRSSCLLIIYLFTIWVLCILYIVWANCLFVSTFKYNKWHFALLLQIWNLSLIICLLLI